MKRKTITSMLVALFCCTSTFAQVVNKTVENLKAGDLTNVLTDAEKEKITNLTITGEMNSIDFNTIKAEIPKIAELDIQKVSILENKPLFSANTIPAKSLQIITLKKITLPETATDIEASAFQGSSALREVIMFNKMVNIKKSAFRWCSDLSKIILPNSLLTIETSAFQGCSILKEITIPESVISIGKSAFFNCPELSTIEVLNKKPLVIDATVFGGSDAAPGLNKTSCKVYVPIGCIDEYKKAPVWGDFAIVSTRSNTAISSITNGETNVWTNNSELFVKSNKVINNVELFAITGQLLNKMAIGTDNFNMNLTNAQISILKINYQDGTSEVTKVKAN